MMYSYMTILKKTKRTKANKNNKREDLIKVEMIDHFVPII